MRFVVDEHLPLSLVSWLADLGHDAVHVLSLNLRQDVRIAAYARETGAVLLTKDRDFAPGSPLVNLPPVVWIRIGNASTADLLARLDQNWIQIVALLETGEQIVEIR